jgi:hypothetical protein
VTQTIDREHTKFLRQWNEVSHAGFGVSAPAMQICPKCQGEMWVDKLTTLGKLEPRTISFTDQPGVIKKILQHIGLWEESHAPPERDPPIKEITFDPSYSQLTNGGYFSLSNSLSSC